MTGAAFASLCRRLANEQASESLFDTGAFMRAEEYATDAKVAAGPAPVVKAELVGIPEIAEMLGVVRATVDKWRRRGVLPAPGWVVGHAPIWEASEIRTWARATGRAA